MSGIALGDTPPPDGPNGGGPTGGAGEMMPVQIEDEMRASYLDYAMSVIIGRALPDVRDGLKPVHRRVLYAMNEASNFHNRAHKKSARVVGDVLGRFHPHGDAAVYDTVVRMAQPFSMRELLIDGQGNFGSVDGDPPAAMRYTEVRLTKLASELLRDIDKNTVDFSPNYDGSTTEPDVLPARFPQLLVNGSQGIAVGMATSIPPHNLKETIDATIRLIEKPSVALEELIRIIPGPDFPTGGIILGRDGIKRAYETGKGSLKVRAVADVEDRKKGGYQIVVTELPYQVNKAKLIERMAELVGEKKLEGISDVRDESDRTGMRIVIELKRDAVPQVTLNQLWRHTALESTFTINMLAIVHGTPVICPLKEVLEHFVEHRREVVTRRTVFELDEAEKTFHTRVGLLVALDNIDRVIELIRGSKDPEEAKTKLVAEPFKRLGNLEGLVNAEDEQVKKAVTDGVIHLTEAQAQAILDLRLHRLTGLEADKLRDEANQLRDTMIRLRGILADDGELMRVITEELREIRDGYGDARRTQITGEAGEYSDEDLIAEEEMVVTVSHTGYAKRTPVSEYRAQKRGGRGVTGVDTKEEDFVEKLFSASTHDYLLVFTTNGRVYWVKVHELPLGARTARGKPLVNIIQLSEDEKVTAILPVREFAENQFVVTCSRLGTVKKTPLLEYSRPRQSGIIGAGINEGDEIIEAAVATDENDILLGTANGMAIRFKASEVRSMGRPSVGVRGIKLDDGDHVVGMAVLDSAASILVVTANGYGKRTLTEEYRPQGRGGRGLITVKTSDRNGQVVTIRQVVDEDHVMVITAKGVIIRMGARDISVMGRNTQGVRMVRLDDDDSVKAVCNLVADEADEETLPPEGAPPAGGPPPS
jgi:DNA gyrase subunit A